MQVHETLHGPYFKYGTKYHIVMMENQDKARPLLDREQKMCQFRMIIAR